MENSSTISGQSSSSGQNLSGQNSSGQSSTGSSASSALTRTGYNLNSKAAFSLDNPSANPDFTAAEIEEQKKAGKELLMAIRIAAQDSSKNEYVIPAGNYGFTMSEMVNGVMSGFVLRDIKRTADKPFTIKAAGVTFWFELTNKPAPNCYRAVHLVNCENVKIEGLTIDAYTANTIEGKLTAIDVTHNKIEIQLSKGSMSDEALIMDFTSTEKRIIPVKANGNTIPALYNIDNTWGVEYLFIRKIEKSKEGHYWLYFKNMTLLNTIFTPDWLSAYGKEGTLETGDGISLIYGSVMAVGLDNCKQITVQDINSYLGRGGFWENGGYGDHKWIRCSFRTRPGTDRILGSEGNMSQGLRKGSLFDHIYVGRTSDDAINIHGFWSKVKNHNGSTIMADYAPVGIQAGDPVEYYDNTGKQVATGKVKTTPSQVYNYNGFLTAPIVLESAPPETVETLRLRWPNSECAGWKITNSTFDGIYQRILIQSGPGTFENNYIRNMGSVLALDTNAASYEGGFLQDIVIRNNVFVNSGIHPGGSPILVSFVRDWSANAHAYNISIKNNFIYKAGASAVNLVNTKNVTISDNVFADLYEPSNAFVSYLDLKNTAVTSELSQGTTISGNRVYIKAGSMFGNGLCNASATLSSNKVNVNAGTILDKIKSAASNTSNNTVAKLTEVLPAP